MSNLDRWFVELKGHQFDLLDWARHLPPPFDPWCEQLWRNGSPLFALFSLSFLGEFDPVEVRDHGSRLIARLNGSLGALVQTEHVKPGMVGRIGRDGTISLVALLESHARGRSRATAIMQSVDEAGNVLPPPPPTLSEAQRWAQASLENEAVAEMLSLASRPESWIDLYKALEFAESLFDGGQHGLCRALGAPGALYRNVRQTANSHRHGPKGNAPCPDRPAGRSEAKRLLAIVLKAVMEHMA